MPFNKEYNAKSQDGSLGKGVATKEYSYDGFDAYIFLEKNDPRKIQICKTSSQEVVIEFDTDAVDCMGFNNIDKRLEALAQDEQRSAIHCFSETLKKYYGGKNLLAVPSKLRDLFHTEGFRTSPETPNGSPYKRLMFVKRSTLEENLSKVIIDQNEKLQILANKYTIVTDKVILQKKAEEISRLFIDNASYASDEAKIRGYSPQAIIHRINNENTYSFAIKDNTNEKIIGFIRVYVAEGLGAYASDLVTHSEKRHQGLAVSLMQNAFLAINNVHTVFLIAGDDNEAEYYEKKLGCKAIYSQEEPLELEKGKNFMFVLIPQQPLLRNLLNSFPMPELPKKLIKSPSAEELSKFHIVASSNKAPSLSLEKSEQSEEAITHGQTIIKN